MRGARWILDVDSISTEELLEAVDEVIAEMWAHRLVADETLRKTIPTSVMIPPAAAEAGTAPARPWKDARLRSVGPSKPWSALRVVSHG
jgi:hypothetical protein